MIAAAFTRFELEDASLGGRPFDKAHQAPNQGNGPVRERCRDSDRNCADALPGQAEEEMFRDKMHVGAMT